MDGQSRLGDAPLEAKRRVVWEATSLAYAAARLLDKPQRFVRRAYALDSRGRSVRVDDAHAVRFCLAGALLRAEHERHETEIPIRTSEVADEDDVLRPILPVDHAPRLRIALAALASVSRVELERLGITFVAVSSEEDEPAPTELHLPLVLSLHRSGGYEGCRAVLETTALVLALLLRDDARVQKLVADSDIAAEVAK
jgi:hypothetical protein